MAIHITDDKHYTAIADQIRHDLGEDYEYTPEMMPSRVHDVYEKGYADGGKDQWRAYCLQTPNSHFDLPAGMTKIPGDMFYDHEGIKSVSIPDTITEIESTAFWGSSVQIRQFPELLSSIEYYAFEYCDNMDVVVFPPSIEYLGEGAFCSCRNLMEVTFVKTAHKSGTPRDIEDDGWNGLFDGCSKLKTINVPWGKNDRINQSAPWGAENAIINYNYWSNIPEVFTFPRGFEKIPDYLFNDSSMDTSLIPKTKEIYLGDECKEIGCYAFTKSPELRKVHLPDGLITVGTHAFSGCDNLKITELPDSVEHLKDSAFAKVRMELTKLPDNLKEICARSLATTEGLARYNKNQFTEIPKGVRSIHNNAFQNNKKLTKLTFLGTPENIANTAFTGCDNLTQITVPWKEGKVAGEFDNKGNRINWGAPNATVIHK